MSIENSVEKMSRDENAWLRKFRQDNLKIFKSLKWDKTKYTQMEFQEEELSVSNKMNGFSIQKTNEGVIFTDIFAAVKNYPFLQDYFHSEENKVSSLVNSSFNSGFFLYVPKNSEETIEIPALLVERTLSKNIIVVDENAKLNLICKSGSDKRADIAGMIFSIHLKDNSQLNLSSLQNLSQETTLLINQTAFLGRDAQLNWSTGTLGGKQVKATRNIELAGEGSSANDMEVFFGNNEQHFELYTNIYHRVPHTTGYSTTKGVLDDSSKALTQGLAKIQKSAPGSDSYLAEHIILVNPNSKAEPMPFMEIDTNDVKAKHSGFVSQLDEEKVFYLQSRGIEEKEARKLIVLGFLSPALDSAMGIKSDIQKLIEGKWKG